MSKFFYQDAPKSKMTRYHFSIQKHNTKKSQTFFINAQNKEDAIKQVTELFHLKNAEFKEGGAYCYYITSRKTTYRLFYPSVFEPNPD